MNCPHCASAATTRRQGRTTLGYQRFNCRSCKRRFNERTGTPFNDLQVPTDVALLAVLWRLRYKLSFRDVAEMLLQRGVEVTHETIREWEFRFATRQSERNGTMDLAAFIDAYKEAIARRVVESYPPRYRPSEQGRALPPLLRAPLGAQADAIRGAALSLEAQRRT